MYHIFTMLSARGFDRTIIALSHVFERMLKPFSAVFSTTDFRLPKDISFGRLAA